MKSFRRIAPILAVTFLGTFLGVISLQATGQDATPIISHAWVKTTVPGSRVSAAYMSIKSTKPLKLVKAETTVAGIAEIHNMTMKDGVMEMKAELAFNVPAGKTIELKPGGMHIMLMQVAKPIKAGDKVPLKLTFDTGGGNSRVVNVEAIARAQSAHHAH